MSTAGTMQLEQGRWVASHHGLLFSHLIRLPAPDRLGVEKCCYFHAFPGTHAHGPCTLTEFHEWSSALAGPLLELLSDTPRGSFDEFDATEHAAAGLSMLCSATMQRFPDNQQGGLNRNRFWEHLLATACLSYRLASYWGKPISPGMAFLAGLLHDVGKLAFDACMPKSYLRVVNHIERSQREDGEAERELLGTDHEEYGAQLARIWKLPANIIEAILLHGFPAEVLRLSDERRKFTGIVALANALAYRAGYGISSLTRLDRVEYLRRALEIPPSILDAAASRLDQLIPPMARCLFSRHENSASSGFGYSDHGPQATASSAARASRKSLSHISIERWTKVMHRFCSSLRVGDTTLDVCTALAEALETDVLGQSFVVWGLDRSGGIMHAVACDRSGLQQRSWSIAGELGNIGIQDIDFQLQAAKPWPALLRGRRASMLEARSGSTLLGGILLEATDLELRVQTSQGQDGCAALTFVSDFFALALSNARLREESIFQLHQQLDQRRRDESDQGRILRTRSLEVLSHLAAGAAHEMNNPLTVISGRAQLLLMDEKLDPALRKSIETIRQECQRCTGIISELMAVAKPASPKPASLLLAHLLENARMKAMAELGVAVHQIELDLADERLAVFADEKQISTAIFALLRNAIEAGSAPSIKVSIYSRSRLTDDPCVVVLRDNGRGMTPEAMASALDPFYSERQAGRGRGLGLSRALRLLERNRGRLDIESSPGRGTKIVISLPAAPLPA